MFVIIIDGKVVVLVFEFNFVVFKFLLGKKLLFFEICSYFNCNF